jgi:hypothetical protein
MAFRSSTSLTPGNGTTAAPAVPSGAAVNDIAVVGIYKESTAAITPPSGFTLKATLNTSATARGSLYVYWKRLTAADSGTYSFSWTGSAWRGAVCGLWSGRVGSGDPFDGTVGTAESTTTVSTLNVSTSPANASGDAVGMWTNFNGGATWTAPTNYTEQQDTNVITLDSRDAVASGSTGSISASATISDFMKGFLGVLQVASSGTTGTVAVTQAADTSSASGVLGYSGTVAATQANQTSSATGQLGYTGTIGITQAYQTSSASGTVATGFTGTVTITQANETASASGVLGYSGTVARTQAANTSSASGTVTSSGFSGSVAVTQASQTSTASGVLGYSGTAAIVQAANTASASGKLGYTGTTARTQANQSAAAAGAVANPVTGTAAITQDSQFSTATGSTQPLVTFGTASAGAGTRPTAQGATAPVPTAVAAASGVASASARTVTVPTATGG